MNAWPQMDPGRHYHSYHYLISFLHLPQVTRRPTSTHLHLLTSVWHGDALVFSIGCSVY